MTSTEFKTPKIAVIGCGITGLSAASRLLSKHPTCHVTVLEATDRSGGIIQTIHHDDFLLELGPDSFITNKPAAVRLCEQIGFSDQLIPTDPTHRRSLVLHNGQPKAVPEGFLLMAPSNLQAVASTDILSSAGRRRLLQEALIPPAPEIVDESLASFVRRRFGNEALDRLVQPLVGGIYTSDPERLSIKATLPRFQMMEQRYGSVTVATLLQNISTETSISPSVHHQSRPTKLQTDEADPTSNVTAESTASSGARYGLFTAPKAGMSSMVSAVQSFVTRSGRADLRFQTKVSRISKSSQHRWKLSLKSVHTGGRSSDSVEEFDAVIVTLPAHLAAQILPDQNTASLASALAAIPYASSAIVVSTHALDDFRHPLDAFGMVIPAIEQRSILAVSFSSRKFPGRAPDGSIVLRTFVGGATQPELFDLTDEQVLQVVERELTELLGMKRSARKTWVARYGQAMPQYHVGHEERVSRISKEAGGLSGLEFAGSAYHGVGIPDSIASGQQAADRVLTSSL